MLPIEEAIDRVLAGVQPVRENEVVRLREGAGRVTGADIRAIRTQPDFDASAMDGYAVRATDTQTQRTLRLIGESAAGRRFDGVVGFGECVRIFTGAPMPFGADAVVLQEDVDRADDSVMLRSSTQTGRHVRPRGNDFTSGDLLVPLGSRLRAASVALVASGGHPDVVVCRQPKVGILSTGDELVRPGQPVGPDQIVASNVYGIAALAEGAGASVIDLGIVGDRMEELDRCLHEAFAAQIDILVTIGGASVGDHDLVASGLQMHGVTLDFMKVAMRPGKPLMAGRYGRTRVLGLPGNPASSLVTATVFLVPLIRRMQGYEHTSCRESGRLACDLPPNDHRTEFMRARLDVTGDGARIEPLARQDSSLLSIFAQADALLVRPANAPKASAGDRCEYIRLA